MALSGPNRPVGLPSAVHRQISNVPGAGCRDTRFHGRVRLLTAFHAVKKVLHVIDGAVLVAVLGQDRVALGHAFAI